MDDPTPFFHLVHVHGDTQNGLIPFGAVPCKKTYHGIHPVIRRRHHPLKHPLEQPQTVHSGKEVRSVPVSQGLGVGQGDGERGARIPDMAEDPPNCLAAGLCRFIEGLFLGKR